MTNWQSHKQMVNLTGAFYVGLLGDLGVAGMMKSLGIFSTGCFSELLWLNYVNYMLF